jgi:hypothetical protein
MMIDRPYTAPHNRNMQNTIVNRERLSDNIGVGDSLALKFLKPRPNPAGLFA